MDRAVEPSEVVAPLKSGNRVFLHGACATSTPLIEALAARSDLENVSLYHIHLNGSLPTAEPAMAGRFRHVSLFTGHNLRKASAEGRADFTPIFLSDIPWLFLSGKVALDAAIVQLSPPDRHGFCTLGPSVDCARAAVDTAPLVLAEINNKMPRTHGNSFVHIDKVARFTVTDRPLLEFPPDVPGEAEQAIARQIAGLIENGSTLQMGIGAIAESVLTELSGHSDLGIHTELLPEGVVKLVEEGVVTNRKKSIGAGRIITSFASGTRRLFDFLDDNPLVEFHGCDKTNDTHTIRQHDRMVAVNGALEIDLTGQVCADSIGSQIYSGIGGQMDFIRGAALAREGKPIIALPATAKKGQMSRIVPVLKPGAGVVTTRGHVHWVVTEFGAVNLHGMNLRERGEALIGLAHPDFRAELTRELKELRHF
ncbi:MAG: 4-hydroxybutyrate CoA-transferase [Candidatus Xenobia bacterium]